MEQMPRTVEQYVTMIAEQRPYTTAQRLALPEEEREKYEEALEHVLETNGALVGASRQR